MLSELIILGRLVDAEVNAVQALSVIGIVGQQVKIPCSSNASLFPKKVIWRRIAGLLPNKSYTEGTRLVLPSVTRQDSGLYRCVSTIQGNETSTYSMLFVADFVPHFDGSNFIEKSLGNEDWKSIEIDASFEPHSSSGLIFYIENKKEVSLNDRKKKRYVGLCLDNGKLLYFYNVGKGPVKMESTSEIQLNQQHRIQMVKDHRGGKLKVDNEDNLWNLSRGKDKFNFNSAKRLYVAGLPEHITAQLRCAAHRYKGIVNFISINNQIIAFSETDFPHSQPVAQSQKCFVENPCLHNGYCIPTNNYKGFRCDCSLAFGYMGEYCERYSNECGNVTCYTGSCMRYKKKPGKCLCPYGYTGQRCSKKLSLPTSSSYQFNGQNSYIALRAPVNLEDVTLKMLITPRNNNRQLLAYIASSYSPVKSNFLALMISGGRLVFAFKNDLESIEIDGGSVRVGQPYEISIKRHHKASEIIVNDTRYVSNIKMDPFPVGTEFFIGGMAPGVKPNAQLEISEYFEGCIHDILLNGIQARLIGGSMSDTGGITECSAQRSRLIPLSTTTVTTTTTELPLLTSTNRLMPCDMDTCGNNGVCENINSTHFRCTCKPFYGGEKCEKFKLIEYAAFFNGKAFIQFASKKFNHTNSEATEIIEFRFKTNSSAAVMFWQGQRYGRALNGEDYISIGINSGFVVYSYELGGGVVTLQSKQPVNDGKQHWLKVTRTGRHGILQIDGEDEKNTVYGSAPGVFAMLNTPGHIYLGGLPDLVKMTDGLHKHNFIGCIADVKMNGDLLDLSVDALDGRAVRPCEQWIQNKTFVRSKQ